MNSNRWLTTLVLLISAATLGPACKSTEQAKSGAEESKKTTQTDEAKSEETGKTELTGGEVKSVAAKKQVTTPTAKAHMKEHLDQADRLRQAVQKGELESTREEIGRAHV